MKDFCTRHLRFLLNVILDFYKERPAPGTYPRLGTFLNKNSIFTSSYVQLRVVVTKRDVRCDQYFGVFGGVTAAGE